MKRTYLSIGIVFVLLTIIAIPAFARDNLYPTPTIPTEMPVSKNLLQKKLNQTKVDVMVEDIKTTFAGDRGFCGTGNIVHQYDWQICLKKGEKLIILECTSFSPKGDPNPPEVIAEQLVEFIKKRI